MLCIRPLRRGRECSWNAERSIYNFDEISLFAKNEPFCLRCREVFAPFRIRLQPRSIGLIRSQAVERDQPPCHIIRSFIRQKIAYKMSSASRNNPAPIFGVLLERTSLEWVDLVAYDAHDRHECPLRGWFGPCIAGNTQRRDRRHHSPDDFAPADALARRLNCVPRRRFRWLHAREYAGCLTETLRLPSNYGCSRECRRPR